MKIILQLPSIIIVACVALSSLVHAEEVFNVSKAGKNKEELIKVFKSIQDIEMAKKYAPASFEVLQKLGSKGYLVYKTRIEYNTIASSMARMGGGGGSYTTSHEVAERSTIYFLVTLEPKNYVDGEIIKGFFTVKSDATKSYMNTVGATKTVAVLDEVIPQPLTQDEFVERLKNGDTWLLKNYKKKKCHGCFGKGKLGALKNYATCPDCNGKGAFMLDCVVKW
jgi:hypothetical protein